MCDGAYWLFNHNLKEIEKIDRKIAKEKAEHDKWFKSLTPESQKLLRESDVKLRRRHFWDWVIVLGIFFGLPIWLLW